MIRLIGFFEFTVTTTFGQWVPIALMMIPQKAFPRLAGVGLFTNSIMFSMAHHAGKMDTPMPFAMLLPWTELIPLLWGCNLTEMHEGHHRYITKNYGLFGCTDKLLGTYRDVRLDKKNYKTS